MIARSQTGKRVRIEIGQTSHSVIVAVVGLKRLPDAEELFTAKGLKRVEDSHVVQVSCENTNGQEAFDPVFDVGVFVSEWEGSFELCESKLVLFLCDPVGL